MPEERDGTRHDEAHDEARAHDAVPGAPHEAGGQAAGAARAGTTGRRERVDIRGAFGEQGEHEADRERHRPDQEARHRRERGEILALLQLHDVGAEQQGPRRGHPHDEPAGKAPPAARSEDDRRHETDEQRRGGTERRVDCRPRLEPPDGQGQLRPQEPPQAQGDERGRPLGRPAGAEQREPDDVGDQRDQRPDATAVHDQGPEGVDQHVDGRYSSDVAGPPLVGTIARWHGDRREHQAGAMSGRPDGLLPGWDSASEEPASVARRDPGSTTAPPGTFGLRVRTVSEVARTVKDAVRTDERLRDLWIEGEVGRVTISSAGHAYFALKDDRSALQCVWFRDDRVRSAFQPQTGLRVVTHGRMDVYEPSGALQLYVDALQPSGFGDLAIRFEQLKARLGAEGLFESARKRSLPSRPATVAVITSPSGAVWRDVCHVLARRWPLVRVVLVACQVQGEGAPASIVGAMRRLERLIAEGHAAGRPDEVPAVTILARGGGSLEDLWSFNDERVVRAVVAHTVPVVCGVGHEVDVTLADFAADVRAPTPSAAAELVVPDRVEVAAAVAAARRRLDRAVERSLVVAGRELATERRALERADPAAQLTAGRERAGLLLDRATRAVAADVARRRSMVDRLGDRLGPSLPGRLVRDRGRLERTTDRLRPLLPVRLARERERVDRAAGRLPVLASNRVTRARSSLDAAVAALSVLGPQATLDRGYAIVRRAADGAIVRDPAQAARGTALRLRVAQGELDATSDGEPAGGSGG